MGALAALVVGAWIYVREHGRGTALFPSSPRTARSRSGTIRLSSSPRSPGGATATRRCEPAFGPLARYIFAKDRSGESIAMTAPVTQTRETSRPNPAPGDGEDRGDRSPARHGACALFMPTGYELEALPRPADEDVTLPLGFRRTARRDPLLGRGDRCAARREGGGPAGLASPRATFPREGSRHLRLSIQTIPSRRVRCAATRVTLLPTSQVPDAARPGGSVGRNRRSPTWLATPRRAFSRRDLPVPAGPPPRQLRPCNAWEDRGGAGDRDRTDDIQLGKLTFYH